MREIDVSYTKRVFGKNLKYYRYMRNLTQEQLAEKIGIDSTSVSDIERGSKGPMFETLTKIANVLNVKLSQLFDEDILDKELPSTIRIFKK